MERDNAKGKAADINQLEKDTQEGKMSARSSKLFEKENEEVRQNLMSNDDEENDAAGVKYIPANSINGDAKINIENVKAAFAGMGKEELMKFANDPFWVRVRWTLFILFWLLWIGMLAGAIAIVVVAPKCAAPAPLKWWEQGPLYKVNVGTFNGNLMGLQSKIDYLKALGIKGIIVESVLKSSDSSTESVVDFKDVDPRYGTLETFKNLANKIKEAGMHLVMSLVPNYSSEQHLWFNRSVHSLRPYTDYYVWASSAEVDGDGKKLPPNNWLSMNGESAWKWNDVRQQFYLHQFNNDQPDLNFENRYVVNEFKDILAFWLEQGASGFLLEKVDYLLEDPEKKDEINAVGLVDVSHNSYDFFSHYRTTNQDGLEELLAEWKEVVVNKTDGDGLFVADRITILEPFNKNASDLLLNSDLFSTLKEGFSAEELLSRTLLQLMHSGNKSRPVWQLNGLAVRLDPDYIDPLNMVAVMLPGTPVFLAGEELGQDLRSNSLLWEKSNTTAGDEDLSVEAQSAPDIKTHLTVFKELARLREEQSIMYGNYSMLLVNNTVFAISWLKSSNPGYLLAFNPSSNNVTVDLTVVDSVPDELTVHIHGADFNVEGANKTPKARSVTFPPRGAAVFTFVPKKVK